MSKHQKTKNRELRRAPAVAVNHFVGLLLPLAAVAMAIISMLGVGLYRAYATDYQTPLNAYLLSQPIGGQTLDQLHTSIDQINAQKVTLNFDGQTANLSLRDLGVELNSDALVGRLGSGDTSLWQGANGRQELSPVWLVTDAYAATQTKLTTTEHPRARDAQLHYQDGQFQVVNSQDGFRVDLAALETSLAASLAGKTSVNVSYLAQAASYSTTQAVADLPKLTAYADRQIAVTVGGSTDQLLIVPLLDITPTTDGLKIALDPDLLTSSLSAIGSSHTEAAWNELYQMNGDSKKILRAGRNGTTIGDLKPLVDQLLSRPVDQLKSVSLPVAEQKFQSLDVASSNTWIDVNLSTFRLTMWENGQVQKVIPISGGKPSTPTPTGEYKILGKVRVMTMSGPGYSTPNIEYVNWFKFNYAIHGAYWHNDFGLKNVSHGCVNARNLDAKYVYEWAPIGTRVSVHY